MSCDGVPSLENVLQAIDALYINPDNSLKEGASKWLCEFQKSVYAWEIADQLLYLKRDLSSSYFGAQTIRIKIQVYFTELPVDAHSGLKESLLNHVQKITTDTPKSIANQLCLAVADLFCQMVEWVDAIPEIVKTLSSSEITSLYLIDILKFIPEEFRSKVLRLGFNRREFIVDQLEANKNLVIEFLSYKAKDASPQTLARIFKCLASWWDHTYLMKEEDIRVSPLLEGAFYILHHPDDYPETTYDAAKEWVLTLLYSHSAESSRSDLIEFLQSNIFILHDVMQQCCLKVSKAAEDGMEEGSVYVDRVASMAEIFASLERCMNIPLFAYPKLPGSNEVGDLRTLECLLSVLEAPPPIGCRENALITFSAFQRLAGDAVQVYNRKRQFPFNPVPPLDAPVRNPDRIMFLLIPYFTRLVVLLVRYCSSCANDLEEAEEIRSFREEVLSLMEEVGDMVGPDAVFRELHNRIKQLQEINTAGSSTNILNEAESCLFMMATVVKRLANNDPEGSIASLISNILLPALAGCPPPPLQEVCCIFFSQLYRWILCHPDLRRQIVEQLIQIVERAADVPLDQLQPGQKFAVNEAIATLSKLCYAYRNTQTATDSSCNGETVILPGELLQEEWNSFILRFVYLLPRLGWAPSSIAVMFFEGVAGGLLYSVVFNPYDDHPRDPLAGRAALPERLAQLSSVSLQCISKLMEHNQPIEYTEALSDPCVWFDYLSAIFRTMENLVKKLDDSQTLEYLKNVYTNSTDNITLVESGRVCLEGCLSVVKAMIWPVIGQALEHYSTKMRCMERCSRVIRYLTRCFTISLREILPDIANKMVIAFEKGKQTCLLYLASILVDVFADIPDCLSGLIGLFEALASPTLTSLSRNLAEQPYTIEDLYRLCARLAQHCPGPFFASPKVNVSGLLDTAVNTLDVLSLPSVVSASGDDEINKPICKENGKEISSKDISNVTSTTVSFLLEAVNFAGSELEDSIPEISAAFNDSELPQSSTEATLAARRILFWMLRPTPATCGGQRLVNICLQSCSNGLSRDRFRDLGDVLDVLKDTVPTEIFSAWIDNTLSGLPVVRADGLVHATREQVDDFKNKIITATSSTEITSALDKFAMLFR